VRVPFDFKDEGCRSKVSLAAQRFSLDPVLVAAIVMQESNGWPDAFRPEPGWKWFWDVKNNKPFRKLYQSEIGALHAPEDFHSLMGTADQEWLLQRSSFGLMQCMGAVARELGLRAPYLSALFDPFEGLQWGCMKLGQLMSQFAGGAISAYNAGSPHVGSDYEVSVLKWVERLRPLFV
jgi:hypothetical protein